MIQLIKQRNNYYLVAKNISTRFSIIFNDASYSTNTLIQKPKLVSNIVATSLRGKLSFECRCSSFARIQDDEAVMEDDNVFEILKRIEQEQRISKATKLCKKIEGYHDAIS